MTLAKPQPTDDFLCFALYSANLAMNRLNERDPSWLLGPRFRGDERREHVTCFPASGVCINKSNRKRQA
jgi:hypothetical protein